MKKVIARSPTYDEVCALVGRFLGHYAIMERALDAAIGELLGLKGRTIDIVGASIPAAKKIDLLFASEKYLATVPESERAKRLQKTRSNLMKLNNERIVVAHCPFEPAGNGSVTFRRAFVTSKPELKTEDVTRSSEEIEEYCNLAIEIANELEVLIAEMRTYVPKLDFSDPRNSMYRMLGF